MKNKILKMLQAKEARKAELGVKSKASTDINEVRSINDEIDAINVEIAELRGVIDGLPAEPQQTEQEARTAAINAAMELEKRGTGYTPGAGFKPLATSTSAGEKRTESEDPYSTMEYRKAFMEYCKTGVQGPELRANAMTTTSDASAVIPTTILNEIIKKVTTYGQVFSRVRKLAVKGGVTVPILSLKPAATWIGENAVSDKQKVQANTKISFSYYGLECKVSTSLLADTVSLPMFENTIIDLVTEAMVKALDVAIIKGTGTGQAKGITVDSRVPAGQIVTLSSADFADWSGWKKKVFAKMPLSYKAGATFLMASGTFEGYVDGMVDANGQPVGRVNYGIADGPTLRFGGKEVIEVEDDIIAPYDDAATGDVVAIYCNLSNYAINSNMQMTMFRYLDHDTNEYVDKAILIVDGQLLDANSVVIVKKGA